MNKNFHATTHAKCILVGEHAVLRGSSAIIFPVKSKSLQLFYAEIPNETVKANFESPYSENLMIFFWDALKVAMKLLDLENQTISGKFSLTNTIPLGYGMGFSSALSVTIAKWLVWKNWLAQDQLFIFSRRIEDHFHGKSSGLDVAGVLSEHGVCFNMQTGIQNLKLTWQPHLYLSPSTTGSSTAKCIEQVEAQWRSNPARAQQIDTEMNESVRVAEIALQENITEKSLNQLSQAIQTAANCFQQWGLINSELEQHMNYLKAQGALAVKPTGSGAGGYVLSLWKNYPSRLNCEMISVF